MSCFREGSLDDGQGRYAHAWSDWAHYRTQHGNPDYGPEKTGEKRVCRRCSESEHRNVRPVMSHDALEFGPS